MLDKEDREALMSFGSEWGLKLIALVSVILVASLTFGIAIRLFEVARG